jgi:hypothetical protein
MVILKTILLIIAFFVSLLWITKLFTDCVSTMYGGNYSDEAAQQDGILRLYMIAIMSVLWSIIIIIW